MKLTTKTLLKSFIITTWMNSYLSLKGCLSKKSMVTFWVLTCTISWEADSSYSVFARNCLLASEFLVIRRGLQAYKSCVFLFTFFGLWNETHKLYTMGGSNFKLKFAVGIIVHIRLWKPQSHTKPQTTLVEGVFLSFFF